MISTWKTPRGMSRRHFMNHLAGSSAAATAALSFGGAIQANADEMRRKPKVRDHALDGRWASDD